MSLCNFIHFTTSFLNKIYPELYIHIRILVRCPYKSTSQRQWSSMISQKIVALMTERSGGTCDLKQVRFQGLSLGEGPRRPRWTVQH